MSSRTRPHGRLFALALAPLSLVAFSACGDDAAPGADAADTPSSADTTPDAGDGTLPGDDATPVDTSGADGETADGALATGAELEAFCTAQLADACTFTERCLPQVTLACATWDPIVRLDEACRIMQAGIASGALVVEKARLDACRAQMAAAECGAGMPFLSGACVNLATPQSEPGEACHSANFFVSSWTTSECAGGTCDTAEGCPGQCVAWRQPGEACGEGGVAVCDPTVGLCLNGECVTYPAEGEACSGERWCAPGFRCDETSRCKALAEAGGSCDTIDDCPWPTTCAGGTCGDTAETLAPCRLDTQCPDAHRCEYTEGEQLCLPIVGEGEGCNTVPAVCGPGLQCGNRSGDEDGWICIEKGGDGDSCDFVECADGFFCDWYETPAICKGRGDIGASCTVDTLQLGACIDGLVCIENECRNAAQDGETCEPLLLESCEAGLWCPADTTTCRPPAALDEACDGNFSATCGDGLWCHVESLTCRPPSAAGARCDIGQVGTCADRTFCGCAEPDEDCDYETTFPTCIAKGADGTPCTDPARCLSDFCDLEGENLVCAPAPVYPPRCVPPAE